MNGRLVSAKGYKDSFHDNAIVTSIPEYVYSKSRIKYPMVRKSYLKGGAGANPEAPGSEGFVRVSWEKATELIAGELKLVLKLCVNCAKMRVL